MTTAKQVSSAVKKLAGHDATHIVTAQEALAEPELKPWEDVKEQLGETRRVALLVGLAGLPALGKYQKGYQQACDDVLELIEREQNPSRVGDMQYLTLDAPSLSTKVRAMMEET